MSKYRLTSRSTRNFFCKSSDGTITYTTDDNFIYAKTPGGEIRLDLFAGHYYKLRPFNGVPILEIDGLRMQLVRDFKTPLDYSKEVVRELNLSKALGCVQTTRKAKLQSRLQKVQTPQKSDLVVLDTCMGLGYTAIAASQSPGVQLVITCECSDAVVTLAQWNPFSDAIFKKDSKIVLMKGNSAELVKGFESGMFSFVIHDPPRISHAPELYSLDFYLELFRVCKKGAKIFHYVGSVGKQKGRRIDKEVEARLLRAGFRGAHYSPLLQGLFAIKP